MIIACREDTGRTDRGHQPVRRTQGGLFEDISLPEGHMKDCQRTTACQKDTVRTVRGHQAASMSARGQQPGEGHKEE